MPICAVKSPALYFADLLDLSRMISTWTLRFLASTRAFAISLLVKEYAWTNISDLALPISLTIASVHLHEG
jgi:hypothetical protein